VNSRQADDRDRLSRPQLARVELRGADRRAVERGGVVGDDGQVVQRVDVLDAPGTSTEPANVRRTSPTEAGTVLRSTTTKPRAASTTTPVPW
jgi:hypothetical protein